MQKTVFVLFAGLMSLTVSAQSLPNHTMAMVNGRPISNELFEQALRANLSQGLKDTAQLRQAIREDLINRELLIQKAETLGLDRSPEAAMQLKRMRENLLVDLLMAGYLKQHPITEEMVRADYDRQVNLLKQSGNLEQLKVSVIVVSSEPEANDILARLKRGISFAALARERSIDASKSNDGVVGWVLLSQLNPVLGEAVSKLKKGAYAGPIATGDGWNIIKLDDKRPFKMPSLEESQNGIISLLVQQRRLQLIEQLRAESKISH